MKYLAALFGIILTVTLIGIYVAPDNLADCDIAPDNRAECRAADAVVAVSGGNTSHRAAEAIDLYKNGWGKYLVFSGAALDESSPSNANVMKRQALMAGIPASAILTDDDARTTHENAKNTRMLFSEKDIDSIILVTSPYHQRRASIEFRMLFPQNVVIRSHPAAGDSDWPWYWWATPRGWWLTGGELVKITLTHAGGSR